MYIIKKKCKSLKVRLVRKKHNLLYIVQKNKFSSFFVVVDFKRLTFFSLVIFETIFYFCLIKSSSLKFQIEMKLKIVEFLLLLFFTFVVKKLNVAFFSHYLFIFQSVREINSFIHLLSCCCFLSFLLLVVVKSSL